VDMIVERTLHVVAAAARRAHGAERKTPRMVGIDQLMADRRRLRQDAEPAERIDPLEGFDGLWLDAGAADAMKAVAAGNEIAVNLASDAILLVSHARMIGVEIVRLDVGRLVDRREPRRLACIHQVERHLGLAVDHHGLAGGGLHVDAVAVACEGELDPVMNESFGMRALSRTDFVEQLDRAFLEQASADAPQHIVAGVTLQDDVVDAVAVQQLPEQQSRRACANDCYFSPQYPSPPVL